MVPKLPRPTRFPRGDRWLGLSTNMIVMAGGGLACTYVVYSGYLQTVLYYTPEQMDEVGVAKELAGSLVGLLSGFFYNYYPPWVTIYMGAILHLFGYSMVWMTLTGVVNPSFWLLCTYFILGVGGDSYIDTGCIVTTLESFRDYRGTAVGILKAQVGLSGAMFVLVYEAFIEPDVSRFTLLVALAPSIAAFSFAYFARPCAREGGDGNNDDESEDIKQRFRLTQGLLLCFGIFLMAVIIINAIFHPGRALLKLYLTIMLGFASAMFTILLTQRPVGFSSHPLGVDAGADDVAERSSGLPDFSRRGSLYRKNPFRPRLEDIHEEEELAALKTTSHASHVDVDMDVDVDVDVDVDEGDFVVVFEGAKGVSAKETRRGPLSSTSSLRGLDFWLVTAMSMVGGGTGLAIINNFAQIGQALGDPKVNVYVGMISVWSSFGHLLGGFGSDFLIKRGYPRPLGLLMAQLLMSSCCLLLATGWTPFLYVGSCMVGMAYGSHWSIQPPILVEVFGLQQFPTLYKINLAAAPMGAYVLSTQVVRSLYDKQAAIYVESHAFNAADETACAGSACFGSSLLVLALLCFLSAAVNFWFMSRTRSVYHRPHASPSPPQVAPFISL